MNDTTLAKRDLFDWLDDLCVRFIINLPVEELAEAERTCFQIEEAQWFYEDFIRPLDPDILPALNLRNFFMLICQYCPILSEYPAEQHAEAFERFLKYKTRVPVRGAIMLNEAMDSVVLVKGWKKNANWSFPRGKINKEEPDLTCAVREVYEETGYDLEAAGLVGDEHNTKSIEVTMREQSLKLFVFRGVPQDTYFEPRTRKEISKIQWYKLSELPTIKKNKQQHEGKGEALATNANKFYMVAPFLGHLKKWIGQQKKLEKPNSNHRATPQHHTEPSATTDVEDHQAEEGLGTRGDIDRLLDAHRQRREAVPQQVLSDLPEVSPPGVPLRRELPPMHIDTVQKADSLNKIDLLAILKGGSNSVQEPPPQTPAAQMIEKPVMPHSPPHHHLSRMPTLPMAPTLSDFNGQSQEVETTGPKIPRVQDVPPPIQPGRLVPQARHLNYDRNQRLQNVPRQVPAPYQRAGDSQFAPSSSQTGSQGLAIPPASNLPKPILTQQKATLLDLFKKGKAVETPTAVPAPAPAKFDDSKPTSSAMFVPPQVLSSSSIAKSSPAQPVTGQKANLLAIFKAPSTSKSPQQQGKESSLQLPSAPVELSAMPSPGHSRESSQNDAKHNKSVTIAKRPAPAVSKLNPPVGATINGPLNIPQFDMIAKHHRESKASTQSKDMQTDKKPPVTILARPSSSHASSADPALDVPASTISRPTAPTPAAASQPGTSSHRKQKAVQPTHLLTPVRTAQPPTPNLEAQPAPPKVFHPQILKRPARSSNELNEMSPIQPLPSPKQALPEQKSSPTAKPTNADHKKSLLSLFTKPSPLSSPSSTMPALADSSFSLVSPVSASRGPQTQLEKQPSWKNTGPLTAKLSQAPSIATAANTEILEQRRSTSPPSTSEEKQYKEARNEAGPTMGNGKEPERRPSAKETPNELKSLLLGRLANIKV